MTNFILRWRPHTAFYLNGSFLEMGLSNNTLRPIGSTTFSNEGFFMFSGSNFLNFSLPSPLSSLRNDFTFFIELKVSPFPSSFDEIFQQIITVSSGAEWSLKLSNSWIFVFSAIVRNQPMENPKKITYRTVPFDSAFPSFSIFIIKSSKKGLKIIINDKVVIDDEVRLENFDKLVGGSDILTLGYDGLSNDGSYFRGFINRMMIWKGLDLPVSSLSRYFECNYAEQFDDSFCNYAGVCLGYDQCLCNAGFRGSNCLQRAFTCFGLRDDEPSVCSGNGQCTGNNICSCNPNYNGTACEKTVSFDTSGPTPTCILNYRGDCVQAYDSESGKAYGYTGTIPNTVSSSESTCQSMEELISVGMTVCSLSFVRADYYLKNLRKNAIVFQTYENKFDNEAYDPILEKTTYFDVENVYTLFINNGSSANSFLPNGGKSVVFSGSTTLILDGNSILSGLRNNFTVSFWIQMKKLRQRQTLIQNNDGTNWEVFITEDNYLALVVNVNVTKTNFTFSIGKPTMVTLTTNSSGGIILYVNTTVVGHVPEMPPISWNSTSTIGYNYFGDDSFLYGMFDNFKVSRYDWTYSDVKREYFKIVGCFKKIPPNTCGGNGNCSDESRCECLVGYYGSECQYSTCYGLQSTDKSICAGHGNCSHPNSCTCRFGYNGANCAFNMTHTSKIIESYSSFFISKYIFWDKFVTYNRYNDNHTKMFYLPSVLSDSVGVKSSVLAISGEDVSPFNMLTNNFRVRFKVSFNVFEGSQSLIFLNSIAGWSLNISGNDLVLNVNRSGCLSQRNFLFPLAFIITDHMYDVIIEKDNQTGIIVFVDGVLKDQISDATEDFISIENGTSYLGNSNFSGVFYGIMIEHISSSIFTLEMDPFYWKCFDIPFSNKKFAQAMVFVMNRIFVNVLMALGVFHVTAPFASTYHQTIKEYVQGEGSVLHQMNALVRLDFLVETAISITTSSTRSMKLGFSLLIPIPLNF